MVKLAPLSLQRRESGSTALYLPLAVRCRRRSRHPHVSVGKWEVRTLMTRFNSGDPNAAGVDPGSLPPSKDQIAFVVNPVTGPQLLVDLA